MENFILYDEIIRDEIRTIYKGRKKGSVSFVAVHCIDKSQRPETTNRVRLTHELKDVHVVEFYEWYETTNHLWLVVELCTGGSLELILQQDGCLPEECVRLFGIDLVRGLHYIHSMGLVFCDIVPSKIQLDSMGALKYDDFSLARVEGENLEEIFNLSSSDSENSENEGSDRDGSSPRLKRTMGSPFYTAPEIFKGEDYSMASDLWSLGCVLYQMFTGHPPFQADQLSEIKELVLNTKHPYPIAKAALQFDDEHVVRPQPPYHMGTAAKDIFREEHKDCSIVKVLVLYNLKHILPVPNLVTCVEYFTLDVMTGSHDSHVSLRHPLCYSECSRLSAKPTSDLCDIIDSLLCKDPAERMNWAKLVGHSFWKGQLEKDNKSTGKAATTPRPGTGELTRRSDLTTMSTTTNMKNLMLVAISPDGRPMSQTSITGGGAKMLLSPRGTSDRPQTSPGPRETSSGEAHFSISARPRTSPAQNEGTPLTKPTTPQRRKPLSQEGDSESRDKRDNHEEDSELVYVVWDLTVAPLCDNPKIQKPASLKYDAKSLPVTAYSKEKLLKLRDVDLVTFLNKLADQVTRMKDKSAPEQRTKSQLLNYAATICSVSRVATLALSSKLVHCMQLCLKATQSLEIRCKAARVIGLAAQNTEELTEDVQLTELITILTEVIRDNAKNARLKQTVLPALGELLFLVATHEEQKGHTVEPWTVPAITYTMISRCIRDGEDAIVQHFAAKTIENITSTSGIHCGKLSTNENGHLLWHLFMHSTADALRVSAISALCRITKQSPAIFQGVIEKAGLPSILEGLSVNISRVQQAIVTMFAWVLTEGAHLQRLLQEKDFTIRIMRLVESPSLVIRAKAFLTIYKIISKNPDMVPLCCQSKLIMFIERDWRKQQGSEVKGDQAQGEYLLNCLELLMSHLVQSMPEVLGAAITSLNDVTGRKHPSSMQAKALKTSLPLITLPHYLMTSQIFRSKITCERFLLDIGDLLIHVRALDANETNIDSAIGSAGMVDFINSVLGILEVISHHPVLLIEQHSIVVENILPPLAALVSSDNGDTRLFCLGLFADIVSLYLNHDNLTEEQSLLNDRFISETVIHSLLPQMEQILLDADPLPLFGSKLLLALLERTPSLARNLEELELIPVLFQALIDHQATPSSSIVRHLVNIMSCLTAYHETDMKMIYDQGIVDHLMNLFQDAWPLCRVGSDEAGENKSAISVLAALSELLHTLLKYVAGVVRNILQATKTGQKADTDVAETLLMTNKSLVDLTDILIQMLCVCDSDLATLSCGCLSLLAQLFGGEYSNALSSQNASGLARALVHLDSKQQKVLLKFMKRIISADPSQADILHGAGSDLTDALKKLIHTASSNADIGISSLSADILGSAGITS